MKAYIIIGCTASGKSSLVRALTGVRNKGRRMMEDVNGANFELWAEDSSLQEACIPPDKIIAEVNSLGVDAVLLTLWPQGRKSKKKPCPSAAGYLSAFQAAQWTLQTVVLLSDLSNVSAARTRAMAGFVPPAGVQTFVASHRPPASNKMAAQVRAVWSWL